MNTILMENTMTTETSDKVPQAPEVPPPPGSGHTPSAADKRDALRAKIEASERRIAERSLADQAREAAGTAKDYTKEHPFVVIGGALAAGLAIGLMTRPGRRVARNAAIGAAGLAGTAAAETQQAGRVAKEKTSRFGDLVSDAITAYGIKLMDGAVDGARAGQDAFEDLGDSAARQARSLKRDADYIAGSTADSARFASRRTRRRANRAVRDIKGR